MDTKEYSTRFCQQCCQDYPPTHEFYYITVRKNGSLKYRCRHCMRQQKKRRYVEKIHIPCAISACPNYIVRKGLCSRHYREQLYGTTGRCVVEGCINKPYVARGFCGMHYRRLRVHGDATVRLTTQRAGITKDGYRLLHGYHGHPNAKVNGAILEHRLVMSQMLGRPLLPQEKVHHKNGIRSFNEPDNLELWIISHPHGQKVQDILAWARNVVAQYGDLENNPYFIAEAVT